MLKIKLALLLAASVALTATSPAGSQGIMLGERPISRAEVAAFAKKQFVEMDTNHDGHVAPAEFEAYRAQQSDRGQMGLAHIGRRWFEKTDTDNDGRVTLDEAVARPLEMFDMADINRDGVASIQEQSVASIFMGR